MSQVQGATTTIESTSGKSVEYEEMQGKQEDRYVKPQLESSIRKKTKMPKKNFDDVEDAGEMVELLKILNISYDRHNTTFNGMKEIAKEAMKKRSSGGGEYLNETTGFSVISKAKEQDMVKRNKLETLYSDVNDDCLKRLDDPLLQILNSFIPDVLNVFNERRESLKKTDYQYHILVAGESSAGKSSFLNLILGEDLLPHHILNTTSTICELKYGEERTLVIHSKNKKEMKPLPRFLSLKTKDECGKTYQEQIGPFMFDKGEHGSAYEKVELLWPHELLEKGVVIIDSPGIGESDEMDQVLINYLPKAFAFIYVIDVSRAGGIQKDGLIQILEKVRSQDGGTEKCNRLAECSLFVCNKWDIVKEKEKDNVKEFLVKRLEECWPGANLNSQVVYMSTTQAIKAQDYGGVTTEFENLLQKIKSMILKAINIRLYNHWLWLDSLQYNIIRCTCFFNRTVELNHHRNSERMNAIKSRMTEMNEKGEKATEDIKLQLKNRTDYLFTKMDEYLQSPGFREKFCTWERTLLPPLEDTWEVTKNNIKKAMELRLAEFLAQWEEEKCIYSAIHSQLVDHFLKSLNLMEDELESVEKVIQADNGSFHKERSWSFSTKIFFGATSPLLIPVGVAGLLISMPVLGAIAVKKGVAGRVKLDRYQRDPSAYLVKRSKKFLKSITEEVLFEHARKQMNKTEVVLSKYMDSIPRVVEAGWKMVSQLTSETRSQAEILQQYRPIEERGVELRGRLTHIGVELCLSTVNSCDLEYKEDMKSCVGEGEFALVYSGKLKTRASTINVESISVVVKVFKKPFDYPNLRSYLEEEVKMRQLNHKNVRKFYGAVKVSTTDGYKFVFVMEACLANLRNVTLADKSKTPAKADNVKPAIETFLKWAIEITDGLSYIHERRLVHGHLKLENIMINEDGQAMIADIAIMGELQAKRGIIYLAPEVLADPLKRSKGADIYSFGIMLWEMWYGAQAFAELMPIDRATFQKGITEAEYRPCRDEMKISVDRVSIVMECCWKTKVNERPSAKECYTNLVEILKGYA